MDNELKEAIDIEWLRGYHDSSFLDPPSYHIEDIKVEGSIWNTLWNCPMCVEKYIERVESLIKSWK